MAAPAPTHVLLLADRDWTHPQTGGNGANIIAQVSRWVAGGTRVTVVAGHHPGAPAFERLGPLLEVHRVGTRTSVFPRGVWKVLRGVGRDADVVLEVINGIPFLTPLWLRRPCVALVHHVHRELYVEEWPRTGRLAAFLIETLPLRLLYRGLPFITISDSARRELEEVGIPPSHTSVAYLGVEPGAFRRSERAAEPALLFVGRLKQYKRIEWLLDVLEALPGTGLDVVGDGDHRPALEGEIERRGLGGRVRLHGHVSEERKAELYGRAWLNLTASASEGWSLTVMEAAAAGTPSIAIAIGGLPESIVDGETGFLAADQAELVARVRQVIEDSALRERLGRAAEERARTFTWERTAQENLAVLEREAARGVPALGSWLARREGVRATALAGAAALAVLALAATPRARA